MLTTIEIEPGFNLTETIDQAVLAAQQLLTDLALAGDFLPQMLSVFGDRLDRAQLEALRQDWISGEFISWPAIEILSAEELSGANGAFAAATNRIYLSRDYLERNRANLSAVSDLVLEEFGHFVDAQINQTDTVGDEGARFKLTVLKAPLQENQIQLLRTEQDKTFLTLRNQSVSVEQQLAGSLGIPSIHEIYENIARTVAYGAEYFDSERERLWKKGDLVKDISETDLFKVDFVQDDQAGSGFWAIGLLSVANGLPILATRGTEPTMLEDLLADSNVEGALSDSHQFLTVPPSCSGSSRGA
ncbi:MAG: hypothetical protein F6J97_26700 [Leptolyngbya sp. SIO4C1]|nr:hypothetical protein [Leptolyngbya sp. SIO4C1]